MNTKLNPDEEVIIECINDFDYEKVDNLNYMFPNDSNFLANKLINDIIISYLYLKSKRDLEEKHRYVKKYRGFLARMSRDLQISKSTLTYHIQNLIKSKFIKEIENQGNTYYILPTPDKRFTLINQETLYFLVRNFRINLIKVYIYLKYLWDTRERRTNLYFTLKDLGLILGYEESYTDNTDFTKHMREILYILNQVKLIEITEQIYVTNTKDDNVLVYPIYCLKNCNSKIKIEFANNTIETEGKKE